MSKQLVAGIFLVLNLCIIAARAQNAPQVPAPATQPFANVPPSCIEFAIRFENEVNAGNKASIDKFINMKRLAGRATKGIDAPRGLKKTFEDMVAERTSIGIELASISQLKKSYKLTYIRRQGEQYLVTYRVRGKNVLNYHELICDRQSVFDWQFIDFSNTSSGEFISGGIRYLYLKELASHSGDIISTLPAMDQDLLRYYAVVQDMANAVEANNPEDALALYATLPRTMAQSKKCMILNVRARSLLRQAKPADFKTAFNEYQQLFPSDTAIDIYCMDSWLAERHYEACFAGLDRMQARFHDPYIPALRAFVLLREEKTANLEKAEQQALEAVHAEPNIYASWDILLLSQIKQNKFDAAVKSLQLYENIYGQPITTFETKPEYADFIASDAYKTYRSATTKQ